MSVIIIGRVWTLEIATSVAASASRQRRVGSVINFFQWNFGLFGQLFAGLEFRRSLHDPAIQFSQFHRNLAKRSFDRGKFAREFASFTKVPANAEGAGFLENQFRKPIGFIFGA